MDQMISKNTRKNPKVAKKMVLCEINEDRPVAPLARGAIPLTIISIRLFTPGSTLWCECILDEKDDTFTRNKVSHNNQSIPPNNNFN